MSIETIIAIVTAGIALVTSVVGFSYNLIQSRKDRVQKIILENRIKYMDEIREGFSSFIGLANTAAINSALKNSEAAKIYYEKLYTGYGKIKTYIKPFYAIDKELLVSLDALYFHMLKLLNGKGAKEAELDALREDFADKYLKYDWAYWKYIQNQKSGNYMNSDDAFDEVYFKFVNSLK